MCSITSDKEKKKQIPLNNPLQSKVMESKSLNCYTKINNYQLSTNLSRRGVEQWKCSGRGSQLYVHEQLWTRRESLQFTSGMVADLPEGKDSGSDKQMMKYSWYSLGEPAGVGKLFSDRGVCFPVYSQHYSSTLTTLFTQLYVLVFSLKFHFLKISLKKKI